MTPGRDRAHQAKIFLQYAAGLAVRPRWRRHIMTSETHNGASKRPLAASCLCCRWRTVGITQRRCREKIPNGSPKSHKQIQIIKHQQVALVFRGAGQSRRPRDPPRGRPDGHTSATAVRTQIISMTCCWLKGLTPTVELPLRRDSVRSVFRRGEVLSC